jgi:predicted sugar kinase
LAHHGKPVRAQVEIETTIPAYMGLESNTLMRLATVQGLSWLHDLPHERSEAAAYGDLLGLEAREGLALAGFQQGGLLLVDTATPTVEQRLTITHEREKDAWSVVLFFPRVPADISPTFEDEQYAALRQAAAHLSVKSGELVTGDLKKALQLNDQVAFGQAIMLLQQMNAQAMAQTGRLLELRADEQGVVEVMRHHGAVAWGRSATGLAMFGIVKGSDASRRLRSAIMKEVGYFGGLVIATIADNDGSRFAVKKEDLNANKLSSVRVRPELQKGRE